jgi:translocation and assembly module TamA
MVGWRSSTSILVDRRGHRMGLNLRLSQPKQDLLYRYVIPTGKPLETFTILTGFTRELRGDTISNRFEIAAIDSRFWGGWRRDLFVIAQVENSDIGGFSFNDVMLIPGIRAIRTRWSELVRPTQGSKIATEFRGSSTKLGSGTDYGQVHARSAFYVPLRPNVRLYLRGEIGATAVAEFPELPASQRFFAGGDRSVRGFALNSLSPRNPSGDLVGGKHLLFGSFEVEYDVFPKWIITPVRGCR